MARIVYWDKNGQEHNVYIGREFPEVTVGRHPDSVIRTSNGSVSRRHCTIEYTAGGIELADQNSSSGTYVNNRRIAKQRLLDGDEIYCGSFVMRFHNDDGGMTLEQDKIVVVRANLSYIDDNNEERQIWLDESNPKVIVGRAVECQIRTSDGSVSRRHSEFVYLNGSFEVVDRGSSNGTYVNGQQVQRQLLKHNDEINCGRLVVRFSLKEEFHHPATSGPMNAQVPPSGNFAPAPRSYQDLPPAQATVLPQSPHDFSAMTGIGQAAPPPIYQAQAEVAPPPVVPRHSPTPLSSSSTPVVPQGVAPDMSQVNALEGQLAEAKSERDALQKRLDEAQSDQDGRIRDLERDVTQKQVVIDSFQERYDRLKIQADEQLQQIESYRDELRQKREVIEDLQYKLSLIEEAHDRGNSQVAELIEENANLKVQVNQLERSLAESERMANLNEFELKRVRSELDGLRDMVSTEGDENADLQNELNRLRLVIDAKESQLVDNERDLKDMRQEIASYREDADRNVAEFDRLKTELESRSKRLDVLLEENQNLRQELEADSARGGNAQNQINELRRKSRDQRHRIEELEALLQEAQAVAPVESPTQPAELERISAEREAMSRRVTELERALDDASRVRGDESAQQDRLRLENRRLQDDLSRALGDLQDARRTAAAAPTPSGPSDNGAALRTAAMATYEPLNDVVSQLKNDMQLLQDYIQDIQKVYENYRRIDLTNPSSLDKIRIDKILREMDPDVTFEELHHILGECTRNSEEMKGKLLEFRDQLID